MYTNKIDKGPNIAKLDTFHKLCDRGKLIARAVPFSRRTFSRFPLSALACALECNLRLGETLYRHRRRRRRNNPWTV